MTSRSRLRKWNIWCERLNSRIGYVDGKMAATESSRSITRKMRRKVSVNSTAGIQWVSDLSMISAGLGLKKAGSEYKGPCPVCGGRDRFWMRPGKSQPIIFACRRGCDFKDIVRSLENTGWIAKSTQKMSPDEVKKLRLNRPLPLVDVVQAHFVLCLIETMCEEASINGSDIEEAQLSIFVNSKKGPRKYDLLNLDEIVLLISEASMMLEKARHSGVTFEGKHYDWR